MTTNSNNPRKNNLPSAEHEPTRERVVKLNTRAVATVASSFIMGIASTIFLQNIQEKSGPKNGITRVEVNDCLNLSGDGPINVGDSKETIRSFSAFGRVSVFLTSGTTRESSLRYPGHFDAYDVPYTTLYIDCGTPVVEPVIMPTIPFVIATPR
jgi:hypothetical protein